MAENTNITVNLENLSDKERETLLAIIEKANKPKPKLWKPNDKEIYYLICEGGMVVETRNSNHHCDRARFSMGNCFRTEEEAEFALERLKVIQKLREFACEKLDDDHIKWYLYLKHGCVCTSWLVSLQGDLCFQTAQDAEAAIKAVGEERIKKYYFGIK